MSIKSSIYGYLFNAIKNGFNYEAAIANFCEFADEVVCATIPSEDYTLDELKRLEKKYSNFKVVETKISLKSNRFDGELKTAALAQTTNPIKIIADFDERFVLSQKPKWEKYYDQLLSSPYDGLLIPTVDLYKDPKLIRADANIGLKFRVHKNTIIKRGVIPDAERRDGLFDTSRSDSTEPLNINGELGNFCPIAPPTALIPIFAQELNKYIFTVHHGFLDLDYRVKINNFWKPHWEARSGHEENVELNKEVLDFKPTIEHNLILE